MLDSKVRFGNRVEQYKKFRPHYPKEALLFIKERFGIDKNWKIADIGAGTGISSKALLDVFGCTVFGVEPNEFMRLEAKTSLSVYPQFCSVNGSAENTTLVDKSINMVTAFQSFHWFDTIKTAREFRRILTKPNLVLLMWNDRRTAGSPFVEQYESLVGSLPEYGIANHKNIQRKEIEAFIGSADIEYAEFENPIKVDLEGLKGRFFSSSYTAAYGTDEYVKQNLLLDELFEKTNQNGTVEFLYKTELYFGTME
jgi:ubiquinone/menaquinone biosynthesis C-methylase UbiE